MSTSNKRSLIFIIIFLLLTNIGVLGYFLWNKNPKKAPAQTSRPDGIATSLQKEVGFDSLQIKEYRKLKEKQWATIKPMFAELRKAKDSLYRFVGNGSADSSLINATADLIAQRQRAIDLQAFTHFRQIRALCKPEQLEKYDSLVQRLVRKMGRPPKSNSDQNKNGKK